MLKTTFSLTMLLAIASVPASSRAQELSENDVQSVFERERPEFAPPGVHAGSFVVTPAIEVKGVQSDNIFATESNEESDIITFISPSIGLASKWQTHKVALKLASRIGQFADFTDENFEDYHAGFEGQVDIQRGQFVNTKLAYDRRHEDRTSPDDVNGTEPTQYDDMKARVDFVRDVSIVSAQVGAQATRLDYKKVDAAGGVVFTNADRDRVEYVTDAKLGYEYIPNYQVYVKGEYAVVQYDITQGLNRDSDGYGVALGTDVNLTGKVQADVYVGYMTREYEDPTLENISNVDFGGNILWNVTPLTSLRSGFDRSIKETIQPGASGYIDSGVSVGVEHELMRNVLVGLDSSYANQSFDGGLLDREDDVYGAGAGVTYLLPYRGLSMGAGYNYSERSSTMATEDYVDNRFMLTLGGRM